MPKTRAQKEKEVKSLSEKLGRAKSIVFADYRGLSMKHLSQLRDQLRDLDAEFTITKNTLLKLALQKPFDTLDTSDTLSTGPTAALFAYDDEISPIKILVKTLKDSGFGKVKLGFLGKDKLDEAKILQLATLPTKDELRGKTIGVLIAPLQGMVSVLQGNLRNLVYALDQIKENQSAFVPQSGTTAPKEGGV